MIEQSTIQKVHDRADMLEVATRYGLTLSRKGSNHWACCPFHHEDTPSFCITPSRNTYHCFGCGKHGSPIDFVMELDNKSYPEAIEHLANMFGIPVMHTYKETTKEQQAK